LKLRRLKSNNYETWGPKLNLNLNLSIKWDIQNFIDLLVKIKHMDDANTILRVLVKQNLD